MPNLAMRQPGTQFSGDGIDLSWPIGGEREVVKVADEDVSIRIRRRIAEGQIVITDDKPTKQADSDARVYKLLTGEEARARMAEPAGPVTRVVYHPATPEDEKYWNPTIQSLETESETFKQAQAVRAQVAEEEHAALTQRQIDAEKAAAEAATDEPEDEDDPIAIRLKRTEEASAEWLAERERSFMERETARQEEEAYTLKAFDAANKKIAKANKASTKVGDATVTSSPDSSEQDKAVMEAEKTREAAEKELEAQRQEEAKKAAESDAPVVDPLAGKTDPYIAEPTGGARTSDPGPVTAPAEAPATEETAKEAPKAAAKPAAKKG